MEDHLCTRYIRKERSAFVNLQRNDGLFDYYTCIESGQLYNYGLGIART